MHLAPDGLMITGCHSSVQTRLGTTLIYVTHDRVEARAMADRIAVFNGGMIE